MAKKMPNYAAMTLDEQLAAYNEMSETKRKSKFKNAAAGAAALEAEWNRLNPTKEAGSGRTPKDAAKKIKVVTAENPRRKDSAAHGYYEALRGGGTVGEYLAKYPDPTLARDARLWLNYNVRDGHVELIG